MIDTKRYMPQTTIDTMKHCVELLQKMIDLNEQDCTAYVGECGADMFRSDLASVIVRLQRILR
jgi:hypothetical protein